MKVECVLTNPLLVEHVAPVLRVLEERGASAKLVCLPPARFVQRRAAKLALYERCVAAVQAAGLVHSNAINADADVALSALGANELFLYRGIKLKLRYGVSLHRAAIHHNFAMTHGFDGILAHGDFERDLFSRWIARDRIARVGMPRHAAYLARPLTKAEARAQLGLGAARAPVIAYFPTWSAQSSLFRFVDALSALAPEYYLIAKPHALSFANPDESMALAKLERAGARLVDELGRGPRHDASVQRGPAPLAVANVFAQLTAAADLVITDATSGAATEVALLAPDTPLLLLSAREPNELFREVEQLGPIVREAHALRAEVKRQLSADEYRHERAHVVSRLFYTPPSGPRAPELAADAVVARAQLPKISGTPSVLERACPQIARVVRGRAITFASNWAPLPPRDIGSSGSG